MEQTWTRHGTGLDQDWTRPWLENGPDLDQRSNRPSPHMEPTWSRLHSVLYLLFYLSSTLVRFIHFHLPPPPHPPSPVAPPVNTHTPRSKLTLSLSLPLSLSSENLSENPQKITTQNIKNKKSFYANSGKVCVPIKCIWDYVQWIQIERIQSEYEWMTSTSHVT